MRNDTTIQAAGYLITLSGETRTFATIVIKGRTYTGEVGSPVGKLFPEQWIDNSLIRGLYQLPEYAFLSVYDAIANEMR